MNQARPDRGLEKLQSLHERANVSKSLKLSEGQRLKLDPTELKRKRRPLPNFNIQLSDLNDSGPSRSVNYDMVELDDDNDDLPEAHDILNTTRPPSAVKGTPSSETHYTNSEVDSLIRALPLDEEGQVGAPLRLSQRKTPLKTGRKSRQARPAPSPARNDTEFPPAKRSRFEDIIELASSPVAKVAISTFLLFVSLNNS